MHADRQHEFFCVGLIAAHLPRAGPAHEHGIDRLEMAWIAHQVQADLAALRSSMHTGGAKVVFHVAGAQRASRVDVFEPGKQCFRGHPDRVDHHGQSSAMAHSQKRGLQMMCGGGIQDTVQERDEPRSPFEGVTFAAHVTSVEETLEDLGFHQVAQSPFPVDGAGIGRFALEATGDPLGTIAISKVHELRADRSAVDLAEFTYAGIRCGLREFGDVGVDLLYHAAKRIDGCLKIAPLPEGPGQRVVPVRRS